ncbi:MAG: hypothetical protein K6B43_12925 [Treponema sp.]|nr:hypothetical protein [Treponema sp.]
MGKKFRAKIRTTTYEEIWREMDEREEWFRQQWAEAENDPEWIEERERLRKERDVANFSEIDDKEVSEEEFKKTELAIIEFLEKLEKEKNGQ